MTRPPLRIALVIGHLGYGGAERQLHELAVGLRSRGAFPGVYCLGEDQEPYGPRLRSRGIEVTTIARHGSFDLRRVLALAARFRRDRPDLVHSFLGNSNPYGFVAARLAGVRTFVASCRNADHPRDRVRAALDRFVLRRASAIVANAVAVREFAVRRFGAPAGRIRVIYNGVDTRRFRPPGTGGGGPPVVGSVGSLLPKKRPDLFVAACERLRRRFPGLDCRHLGEGPLRDSLVSRYGTAVRFLGASPFPERFLASLDVFVLCSDHEGCPNALLEAMACARAVVATDAGGTAEIVADGRTGFVVPRGDLEALIDRAARLIGDPALRRQLGTAARAEVEARFTIERAVHETLALYRECLAAEGRAP